MRVQTPPSSTRSPTRALVALNASMAAWTLAVVAIPSLRTGRLPSEADIATLEEIETAALVLFVSAAVLVPVALRVTFETRRVGDGGVATTLGLLLCVVLMVLSTRLAIAIVNWI